MIEQNLTGYAVWVAGASLLGLVLFFIFSRQKKLGSAAGWTAALAVPLAVIGARLLYVLVRIEWFQEIGLENIFWPIGGDYNYWGSAQGFGLWGAVGGAALAAVIAAKKTRRSTGDIMDALAPAAALIIALCRFGEFLNGEGLGPEVENDSLMFFPFAVTDEWGGQYAVFMLEGLAGLIILAVVLTVGRKYSGGNRARLFLLLYSSSQIVLESLRHDYCLTWQFLKISQLICALVLAGMMLAATLRHNRSKGVLWVCWIVFLAVIGLLIWTEFAIDKSADLSLEMAAVLELLSCTVLGISAGTVVLPGKTGGKGK